MRTTVVLLGCLFIVSFLGSNSYAFRTLNSDVGPQYRFDSHEFVYINGNPNNIDITGMLEKYNISTRGLSLARVKLILEGRVTATFQTYKMSTDRERYDVDLSYCEEGRDYYDNGKYYPVQADFRNRRCFVEFDKQGGIGDVRNLGSLDASPQNRIFFAQNFSTKDKRWSMSLTNHKKFVLKGLHITVLR